MSLGGIAIAIGAMVDAVIIMIQNAHKHMERDQGRNPTGTSSGTPRSRSGRHCFTRSWLSPSRSSRLHAGSRRRLFKPLAFTKTYSMVGGAALDHPGADFDGFFIRGKIPAEERNPINRFLIWAYHPLIDLVIKWRWLVTFSAAGVIVWVFFPSNRLAARWLPDGPVKEWAFKVGKLFPYQNIGSEEHAAALRR